MASVVVAPLLVFDCCYILCHQWRRYGPRFPQKNSVISRGIVVKLPQLTVSNHCYFQLNENQLCCKNIRNIQYCYYLLVWTTKNLLTEKMLYTELDMLVLNSCRKQLFRSIILPEIWQFSADKTFSRPWKTVVSNDVCCWYYKKIVSVVWQGIVGGLCSSRNYRQRRISLFIDGCESLLLRDGVS